MKQKTCLINVRIVYLLIAFLCLKVGTVSAQIDKRFYFKDSTDGSFDVSNWLINARGFIPIPMLITEPALGGIGGGVFLIFITKNPPYLDTVNGEVKRKLNPPDITGVGGIYTANNTWLTGAITSGTWVKPRIRYRLAAGYGSINLAFYKKLAVVGEQSFDFNFKVAPVFGFMMKEIGRSDWYAGVQYMYMHNEITQGDQLFPEYVIPKEVKANVSQPGVIVEYDVRDNIFTPNSGFKFHTDFSVSDEVVGSDFNYQRLNAYVYSYYPFTPRLIGGLRLDMQEAFGNAPFYFLPFIDMRGIPAARYQGMIDALTEGELRWDCYKRWSVVGFGGTGKAFDTWNTFKDADWVYSYGGGFRYLMASKFKLRMGVDIARGPEQWAYYIVFGSSWLK
jgi:hypothetical protein